MITIKELNYSNLEGTLDLVCQSYFNSPVFKIVGDLEHREERSQELAANFQRQPFKRVAIDQFGNVVGYICATAMVGPDSYLVVQETGWYVLPYYRNTRAGLMLFKELERWAEDVNADSICVSHYRGDDRVGNFYQRKGYKPVEVMYLKKL